MYKKNLVIRSPEIADLLGEMFRLIPEEKRTEDMLKRVCYWRDHVFGPPYPMLAREGDIVLTLSGGAALEATRPLGAIVPPLEGSEVTETIGAMVVGGGDMVDFPSEI